MEYNVGVPLPTSAFMAQGEITRVTAATPPRVDEETAASVVLHQPLTEGRSPSRKTLAGKKKEKKKNTKKTKNAVFVNTTGHRQDSAEWEVAQRGCWLAGWQAHTD